MFSQSHRSCPKTAGKVVGVASHNEPRLAVATTGKHQEARSALAEIYNWFTEGFDTKDLQEAKALLEEVTVP